MKYMHDNKENQTSHLNQVMQQIHQHNSKVRSSKSGVNTSIGSNANTRRSHKDLLKSLSQMSA